jgi:hypothetical protein
MPPPNPTTLLLRAPTPLIPGLVRITIQPSAEALTAWRGGAATHPPGAPPRPSPAVEAAARAANLIPAGAGVPVPSGSTTVVVYCLKVRGEGCTR